MSIVNKKQKDKYQIQVISGYKIENGVKKPIRYTEIFYGKKTDAKIRESEIKSKIKKGVFVSNEKLSFNDLIDKWYTEIATHKLAPKTIQEYNRLLKLSFRRNK